MPSYNLKVNQETHSVTADADTPLLWILRDHLRLVGTKYGCGIAQCGACTVHVDGAPMRSCTMQISQVKDAEIITIEGLSAKGDHALQQAWKDHDVPQCGYCQSGQIMTAAALVRDYPDASDDEISQTMNAHICRCGSYPKIHQAIKSVLS